MKNEQMLLLTVPEAAKRLRLGRSLMYELVRRGEIRSIKIGRLRRVPAAELEEFIARCCAVEGKGPAYSMPLPIKYRNSGC